MWDTEIKKDCTRYHTGLPSKKGVMLIRSIQGQLSDGMWENSPRMEGYWKFFCVEETGDGVVDICISNKCMQTSYYGIPIQNKLRWKTYPEILKWLAEKARQIAKQEEKDWPDRPFRLAEGNKGVSIYIGQGLTGHDIWVMRKMLLGLAKASI